MGMLASLSRQARDAAAQYKTVDASDLTWTALLGIPSSKAGVAVNIDTALRVTTFLACTRVLAEGVAQLPLGIDRIGDDGRTRMPATDLKLYSLLADAPCDFVNSFEFREMMMIHAVTQGNALAYVGRGGTRRDGRGLAEIQEIIPLPGPWRVERLSDFSLRYYVQNIDEPLTSDQVFHLRGGMWNGYLGLDILTLAREAIGLAIATEETHARLFSNGAQPGGLLSVQGQLSKENREALKNKIAEFQEGLHAAHKTMVLDQSATWSSMTMKGVDSEHLDTRRFQIEEICRTVRVFPQMVMSTDKTSTFASAEQFFLAHVTHSLMPWIRRWEHALEHQLIGINNSLKPRFRVAEILRGTPTEQAAYLEKALGGARGETAWMTRNEARETQHLNPIAGGDVLPTPVVNPKPIVGAPAGEDLQDGA
jgi:HK97 family phage portal protein